MRHRKYTFKLGRSSAHRRAMLANMAVSLIYEGEIKTTLPKAKEARRFIEKLVTLAKKAAASDDKAKKVHYIRLAVAKIKDKSAVKHLFDDIAYGYLKRHGGYTRIIRLGKFRRGDAAEVCLLQWVEGEEKDKKENAEKPEESTDITAKTEDKAEISENVAATETAGVSSEEKNEEEAK